MMNTIEIDALFHFSTESKNTEAEKKEKSDRRIETVCMKVVEVREAIYDSRKGVIDSIQIVNERYANILTDEEVANAVNELVAFAKILSNSHIDICTKASIIRSFDLRDYKKLLNTCKFNGLKSISRLTNMKTLSSKFIHGQFSKKHYSDDLKEQVVFFDDLVSKYENICAENCYAYILRYDLKTIKKRTTDRVRTRSKKF